MDPALQELFEEGAPDDEVAVIIRLRRPGDRPPLTTIVSRFGDIVTARVPRGSIPKLWADATTVSVKAAREYGPEIEDWGAEAEPEAPQDRTRPEGLKATGRGVVIGVVDWGCDFAHPDFRHEDGRTRLLGLWDQRPSNTRAEPYGYGRMFTAAQINAALDQADPYGALDYHPADFDAGMGSHGTHTMSIAAGNGRAGGPVGMAPEADCVFVSLGKLGPGVSAVPLGDSVELLEAIDFVAATAADRPFVINLSLGRHAGEHTGHTLVEMAMDYLVTSAPGRAIVQSCGNYFEKRAHSSWVMRPGEVRRFTVEIDPSDRTTNELDIWYPGRDRITVELASMDGSVRRMVPLGDKASLTINGRSVARVRHRRFDPNNGDHQCSIVLDATQPNRVWDVTLYAEDIVDGRVHAWIERDSACRTCQSRFSKEDSDTLSTTGTIANGYHTLVVGAYDAHRRERPVARFSSSGPTRDGRQKPDLVAPGVMVLGARSSVSTPSGAYVRMSGSSMAAPSVTGAVALLFEQSGRKLSIRETRQALLASCDPAPSGSGIHRLGSGFLNPQRALTCLSLQQSPLGRHRRFAPWRPCTDDRKLFKSTEEGITLAESVETQSGEGAETEEFDQDHDLDAWEGINPTSLFDAFTAPESVPTSPFADAFAVVGGPNQVLRSGVRPGDLVISRARGIPFATLSVLTGRGLRPHDRIRPTGNPIQPGYYAATLSGGRSGEQGVASCRVTNSQGVVPSHVLILRPRSRAVAESVDQADVEAADYQPYQMCTPAPEPDPRYGGRNPLLRRGGRRPAVGYAQQCLNNWMQRYQAGTEPGSGQGYAGRYVGDAIRSLATAGQMPLKVDCHYGSHTERAVRAFQTAKGLRADGVIGPITWPLLITYGAGDPSTTYPPPVYQPPPPPVYQPPPPPVYQPPPPPVYQPPPPPVYQPPPPPVYQPPPPPVYQPPPPPPPAPYESDESVEDTQEDFPSEAIACIAAPEPDPTGRGPRPMIKRGSRRPAVGYAQKCLNNWMNGHASGAEGCHGEAFVTSSLTVLAANGQFPLQVDCEFGSNTDRATRAFQTCKAIEVDGKIGAITWRLLEVYAPGVTPSPPVPRPPVPRPPVPVPPSPPGVFERRDVWRLSTQNVWHPTILWYARAVGAMQAKDLGNFSDPTCWRHLAEAHGASIGQANWPRGAQWNQCQHASWFFFPWHRMYVHHLEKIVRDAISSLGGPRDWALPYWDYSDPNRPETRQLPPAFRERNLPNGEGRNPLFINERGPNMNTTGRLDEDDVATGAAMRESVFTSSLGGTTGFGGPATGFNHRGGSTGSLEGVPHGTVHTGVGGRNGWMSDFNTAARDPIFWLHHANVDRLWEVWLRQTGRRNPTDRRWLEQRFAFGITGTPSATALAVRDVLNTTAAPLRYRYSDMPAIQPESIDDSIPEPLRELDEADDIDRVPPELVGATRSAVPLGPSTTVTHIAVSRPTGPSRASRLARESDADAESPRQVFLKLENIKGSQLSAGSFDVHLNVPEGANPAAFRDRRVGRISMFGVREASRRDDQHSGSGLTHSFDVTGIVRALEAAGMWDPERLRVSFTPVPDSAGEVHEGNVTVGRVSLFYK